MSWPTPALATSVTEQVRKDPNITMAHGAPFCTPNGSKCAPDVPRLADSYGDAISVALALSFILNPETGLLPKAEQRMQPEAT